MKAAATAFDASRKPRWLEQHERRRRSKREAARALTRVRRIEIRHEIEEALELAISPRMAHALRREQHHHEMAWKEALR